MSGRCIGFVSSSELLALPGEVQLCNILIEGATQLIKWENMMEVGDKAAAEAEIEAMVGAAAVHRLSFGRSHWELSIRQNPALRPS